MTGIEWLRSLHTKQLIKLKNEFYELFWRRGYVRYDDEVTFTYRELKQVLSERPHIPNGAETKRIRKIAAEYKIRIHQSRN